MISTLQQNDYFTFLVSNDWTCLKYKRCKWVMQTFTIQEKQNTDSDQNKHLDL